ncbi:hypothetical protein AVEN_83422-1, partial [Araneus ventricosus]
MYLQSTIFQKRRSLTTVSIHLDILQNIETEEILKDFADEKTRKTGHRETTRTIGEREISSSIKKLALMFFKHHLLNKESRPTSAPSSSTSIGDVPNQDCWDSPVNHLFGISERLHFQWML